MGAGDHFVVDEEFDVFANVAFFGAEALPDAGMEVVEGSKKLLYGVGSQDDLALAPTVGA